MVYEISEKTAKIRRDILLKAINNLNSAVEFNLNGWGARSDQYLMEYLNIKNACEGLFSFMLEMNLIKLDDILKWDVTKRQLPKLLEKKKNEKNKT